MQMSDMSINNSISFWKYSKLDFLGMFSHYWFDFKWFWKSWCYNLPISLQGRDSHVKTLMCREESLKILNFLTVFEKFFFNLLVKRNFSMLKNPFGNGVSRKKAWFWFSKSDFENMSPISKKIQKYYPNQKSFQNKFNYCGIAKIW